MSSAPRTPGRFAALLRAAGLKYPRDLAVWLGSVARAPVWQVPVLTYHRIAEPSGRGSEDPYSVTPQAFAEQMAHLVEHGYRTIFASELVEAVTLSRPLPGRTVVLTFDDGFASVRDHAAPTLSNLRLKASIFLITARTLRGEPEYLTKADVHNLDDTGLFEFGSHTQHHRQLPSAGSAERRSELAESKRDVEELTGRACATFCFPFGAVDAEAVTSVRDAGYRGAFSSAQGVLHSSRTLFSLARIPVCTEPIAIFGAKVKGWRRRPWPSLLVPGASVEGGASNVGR